MAGVVLVLPGHRIGLVGLSATCIMLRMSLYNYLKQHISGAPLAWAFGRQGMLLRQ